MVDGWKAQVGDRQAHDVGQVLDMAVVPAEPVTATR